MQIDSDAGTVVHSDAFLYYENVENDHLLGVGESCEEAMVAYKRARETADYIIQAHDPKVLERYPNGRIGYLSNLAPLTTACNRRWCALWEVMCLHYRTRSLRVVTPIGFTNRAIGV